MATAIAVDLSLADTHLRELYHEYGEDRFDAFADAALDHLMEQFQPESAQGIQSSRLLMGREARKSGWNDLLRQPEFKKTEFEQLVGELFAIAPGVVFLRPWHGMWQEYAGLVRRNLGVVPRERQRDWSGTFTEFEVPVSVTRRGVALTFCSLLTGGYYANGFIECTGGRNADSPAYCLIDRGRGIDLRVWLDHWLPSERA